MQVARAGCGCGCRVRVPVRVPVRVRVLGGLAVVLAGAGSLLASTYDDRRAAAVKQCEAMDPAQYRSGLFGNPDGYRSFYLQSECLQRAAVEFRDTTLCSKVRRRYSLTSSSWGYSPSQCRKLVAEGVAHDRRTLEDLRAKYAAGHMRLLDFQVVRNGNGRDVDIIPSFAGASGASYTLTFEMLPPDAGPRPVVFHSSGYFVDPNGQLRLYVPQADIRGRFPAFALNRAYDVRATMTLAIGNGDSNGMWSDVFVERTFPARERSQSLTKRTVF